MKDSLTIDHGRKTASRVGRCTDCRSEGVVTPTTRAWGGIALCVTLHIESREAIWNDCQVSAMQNTTVVLFLKSPVAFAECITISERKLSKMQYFQHLVRRNAMGRYG